ncbi:SDR family oxidoreductase [Pleomorphovibrio marinus]|uniref:SDR family oxidoreductase n=1 Tax=Pleomorphovibrio marinus TaxID=2164132 RepID=UPI000E0ACF29|nr:SDR family oxidoreductase [Pleomorphovibrio marinus]
MSIKKNDPMKILITGANGLLGQKLVKRISASEHMIAIATSKSSCRLPSDWTGFTFEQMDVCNQKQVMETLRFYKPDVVIHAASMTDVDRCEVNHDECYKQNVLATENVLRACEMTGSHLIFLSTDFVFDGKNGPYLENAPTNPINYYGRAKQQSEKIIQDSNAIWTIVRTNLVFGIAHDLSRSNLVLWVKHALELGKELQLVDDQIRTPTLAEDLADGCLLIALKEATGIFNISGRELLTPYEMGIMTARYFGLDEYKILKTDSRHFSQVAPRPLRTGLIIDKAVQILGFEPKSFEEGIGILTKQFNLASQKI